MYTPVCNNLVAWGTDNLLCEFHITVTFCYDICNSTDILCIILYYINVIYVMLKPQILH